MHARGPEHGVVRENFRKHCSGEENHNAKTSVRFDVTRTTTILDERSGVENQRKSKQGSEEGEEKEESDTETGEGKVENYIFVVTYRHHFLYVAWGTTTRVEWQCLED